METEGPLAFTNVPSVRFKAAVESSMKKIIIKCKKKQAGCWCAGCSKLSSSKGHYGELFVGTVRTVLRINIKK